MKQCPKCGSAKLSLYYRDNEPNKGKRTWTKVKPKYCKQCKEVIE